MSNISLHIAFGLFLTVGLTVQLVIAYRRHKQDHRKDLEPILSDHGLTFVSARWPGLFKVGPFLKFEIDVKRPQSRIGSLRGEYDEYRIVTAKDSQGNMYQLWAKLEFEVFKLQSIKWRIEEGRPVPTQIVEIIDN